MKNRRLAAACVATAVVISPVLAQPASAARSDFKNCTALHKVYPHGVGKANARDKTSGTPVTTFKRSTKIYNKAMRINRDLDRDGDNIACEKR